MRRISENSASPDPGHNKAISQAVNRVRNAKAGVGKSCAAFAGVAAAVTAAEAAIEAAGPYLIVGVAM